MSQAADVHAGPASPCSPASALRREPRRLPPSRVALAVHDVSATHAATPQAAISTGQPAGAPIPRRTISAAPGYEWQIWAGQYLGIAVLVAVSVAAGRGLTLIPERWIWLLGLLPLGLGAGKLIIAIRTRRRRGQAVVAAASSLPGIAGIAMPTAVTTWPPTPRSSPPSAAPPRRSRPWCSPPVPRCGAWPGGGWSSITASPMPCGAGITRSFPPSMSSSACTSSRRPAPSAASSSRAPGQPGPSPAGAVAARPVRASDITERAGSPPWRNRPLRGRASRPPSRLHGTLIVIHPRVVGWLCGCVPLGGEMDMPLTGHPSVAWPGGEVNQTAAWGLLVRTWPLVSASRS